MTCLFLYTVDGRGTRWVSLIRLLFDENAGAQRFIAWQIIFLLYNNIILATTNYCYEMMLPK